MIIYMDLENLLKEKNISKNKLCEACNLQRTQLNNYCGFDKNLLFFYFTADKVPVFRSADHYTVRMILCSYHTHEQPASTQDPP